MSQLIQKYLLTPIFMCRSSLGRKGLYCHTFKYAPAFASTWWKRILVNVNKPLPQNMMTLQRAKPSKMNWTKIFWGSKNISNSTNETKTDVSWRMSQKCVWDGCKTSGLVAILFQCVKFRDFHTIWDKKKTFVLHVVSHTCHNVKSTSTIGILLTCGFRKRLPSWKRV